VTPTEPRRRGGGAQADRGAIVVGGEALVDLVAGATDELSAHLGGGPFNCARTLGRLKRPVAYLGRISSDRFGARLREQLAADGVSLDAVVDTDDPTTLALAELDDAGTATYRFYVEGTSAPGLTPEAALGGPLAQVCSGDSIRLDVANRRIDLLVDDAELARRRDRFAAHGASGAAPRPTRGYAALFHRSVLQADEGCDFDFLVPGRAELPR